MNRSTLTKATILLLLALLLAACGGEEEVIPTPVPTEPPPTAVPTEIPPTPEPEAVEPTPAPTVGPQQLQAATVQIYAQFEERGDLRTNWTGSGTIISADGLILTNAHVAAPLSPGLAALYNEPEFIFGEEPDALVVGIVESADLPPVETYYAEVVNADGVLDLAVIRITETVDGSPIDANTLNLPFVTLGDSDTLNLGDEVQVYGFPSIGGETITFTRGDVAGFEIEDQVGTRAWIKTDTTFSPGNSGGLGANIAGEIVGVPSFVFEAQGGSINRLRSINYAKPMIEAAQNNATYESPFVVLGTGSESFEFITWSEDFDEDTNCAIGPVKSYAADTPAAVAIFSYSGMSDGEQVIVAWFAEDEFLFSEIFAWDGGESGDCAAFYIHNYGEPIGEGVFSVEIYAGADADFLAGSQVAVGGTAVVDSGSTTSTTGSKSDAGSITVTGQVVNADSGQPISDAVVILLNPGTDVDAWLDDPLDSDIYTMAETSGKGKFTLPLPLERGLEYPGIAWKEGFIPNEGFLSFDEDDPDTIDLVLELSQ